MARRREARTARGEAAGVGVRAAMGLLGLLWVGIGLVPPVAIFARPFEDLRWVVVIAGLIGVLALMLREENMNPSMGLDWREVVRSREPVALGALLVGVGLLVSSVASPNPVLGLRVGVRELFLVGTAFCLSPWKLNQKETGWLLGCLLAAVLIQALVGLYQAFASGAGRGAMSGTIGQSEALSDFVAMGAAAAAIAAMAETRRSVRILYSAILVVCIAAVFVAGGRGGALGGIVAIGAGVIARGFSKMPIRRLAVPIAIGAGVVVLLGTIYFALPKGAGQNTLVSRMTEVVNPHSVPIRHRIGLITIASHMVADRPLVGAGPGRFAAGFSAMQGRLAEHETGTGFWSFNEMTSRLVPTEGHCDPLQWWAEYGLLPCLGLVLMVASAIVFGAGAARKSEPARAALWAAFIAMAVVMWVSYPLHDPMRGVFFWGLLGVVAKPEK